MSYFLEPRSDNDYGESESYEAESSHGCADILWLPAAFVAMFFVGIIPLLVLIAYFCADVYSTAKRTIEDGKLARPYLAQAGAALALVLIVANSDPYNKPIRLKPEVTVLAIGFVLAFTVIPYLALGLHFLDRIHSPMKAQRLSYVWLVVLVGMIAIGLAAVLFGRAPRINPVPIVSPPTVSVSRATAPSVHAQNSQATVESPPIVMTHVPGPSVVPPAVKRSVNTLVDDFDPQPYQGESVYFFNRLEGDRGAINNSLIDWGAGQVTTTISSGNVWGGVWLSLNHPIREGLPINFSAILPSQILPEYQSQITGLTVRIARGTPHAAFRLELKYRGDLQWKHEIELTGGDQTIGLDLPPLGNINELVWVLDRAVASDYVVLDSVSFTATTAITDTATAAFVWSYGQLLNNWNPATGLVRDKAKDASGEFDAIQATGGLAAATASAYQLRMVDRAGAVQIVDRISRTLLIDLPRFHGLWPHWVKSSASGSITIVPGTEWSSVDTVIAAIGLLDAQSGLGLDTSGTEQFLQAIDWQGLVMPGGLSHGYTYSGEPIPYAWDVFGGESWLVELAYAGATGQVTPITYPSPATANGSGFIDELAWLYVAPPSTPDYWGTDWSAYRSSAANYQIRYFSDHYPTGCLAQLGLFGLSAGEVPAPSIVPPASIYQAFGLGGRFAAPNDGTAALGAPVITPHYAAMIASLQPQAAVQLWDRLIAAGYLSPLNNVESLMFPAGSPCEATSIVWNQLKGSWNLTLQTLGWGRYLAERNGLVPIMWQATTANTLLQKGYGLLTSSELSQAPTSVPTAENTQMPVPEAGMILEGGSVRALAFEPSAPAAFYAATDRGVFKSMNGGRSWSAVNIGLSDQNVLALALAPGSPATLYAGTRSGVFRSKSGGTDWTAVNTGLTAPYVNVLAIDPATPETVYAATPHGIFKSTNGGNSWRAVTEEPIHAPVSTERDPNGLFMTPKYTEALDPTSPTTVYAGTASYTYPGTWRFVRGGVFKSTDGGQSWNPLYDGNTSFSVLLIDSATPTTVYVGTNNTGLFKSMDGGQTWAAINDGLPHPTIYAMTFDPAVPTTLYVLTDDGVFTSMNGGQNWSQFGRD